MKYFILWVFLFSWFISNGQINEYGIPLYKNYRSVDYNSSDQNWCTARDSRGVIFFGNTNGVLEYDGGTWKEIPITNGSIVRSLEFDNNGILHVGAVSEIGYLQPTGDGRLEYISFLAQLDSVNRNFTGVWRILKQNGQIIFVTQKYLFFFKDLKLQKSIKLEPYAFMSFIHNNRIYTGNFMEGLLYLNERDSFEIAKGGEYFAKNNIFTILPFRNQMLIGTGNKGVCLFDNTSGYVKENIVSTWFNDIFENNEAILYGGVKLSDEEYMIPTIYKGGFIFNEKGHITSHFQKENGFSDDINTSAYQYNDVRGKESLWLTYDNGISKLELNSPLRHFNETFGYEGAILNITEFQNHLYIGTMTGTYVKKNDSKGYSIFEKIPQITTTWSFEKIKLNGKETLLIGADNGLFYLDENNKPREFEKLVQNIEPKGTKYIVYKLFFSQKNNHKYLYIGGQSSIVVLEYDNGKWFERFDYKDNEIKYIAEDTEGNIWFTPFFSGVCKIIHEKDSFFVEKYNTENGLPGIDANAVFSYNSDFIVCSQKGFYRYNKQENLFVPDTIINNEYNYDNIAISRFFSDDQGNIIVAANNDKEYWVDLYMKNDNDFSVIRKPFKRLPKQIVDAVYKDKDGIIWIAISNQIFSYNPNYEKSYDKKYSALIRKAIIGEDSVLFNGTFYKEIDGKRIVSTNQTSEFEYILDYANNGITFNYASPFFENEEETEYSYYLQGFKDPWSKWTDRRERVYTNLDEGDYVFKVKARNVYGEESQVANFKFTVLPPWYKTVFAYIGYVILAIILIYVIVKIYTRRLELEKIRLEGLVKERTAEVVRQKDEIEEQKQEIMASIYYARRIQRAVVPSPERAKEVLPEHFILWLPRDVVSGDFWWMTVKNDKIIIVAADSTGHGVPGAFMSMLGVSFLNEIVNKVDVTTASVILNELRKSVKVTLKQTGKEGEAKDGMDAALVIIDQKSRVLQFAGAYNPIFIYRDTELIEIKGDRNPIGIHVKEKDSFTNHEFEYQSGDTFYIFSDGYVDQFGGEKGHKFKTKNFKVLLSELQNEPMAKQREILEQGMLDWRGEQEQIDDIIVLGVRLT